MGAKKQGVLFARLALCYHRHPRFVRAGPAASGYWSAVLAWLREEETADGVIPYDMVGQPWSVGKTAGMKFSEKLCSPDVGLFAKRAHGYELLRYAEFNDTKEDIEARREADRSKKQAQRANMSPGDTRGTWGGTSMGTDQGTGGGTEQGTPQVVPVSVSDSVSLSVLQGEMQGGAKPKRAPRAPKEKKSLTTCPTPEDAGCSDWLAYWGIPAISEDPFVETFLRKCVAKGAAYKDWRQTYLVWKQNEVKWAAERAARPGSGAASGTYKRSAWLPPKQPAPPPSANAPWVDAMERDGEEQDRRFAEEQKAKGGT